MSESITLDLSDPFDAALWEMSQLHRKKKADYAVDGTEWSNFEDTSSFLGLPGLGTQEAIDINIGQKMARLKSLRVNGRMDDPKNESVLDTRRDLAVYAVLSLVHASEIVVDEGSTAVVL
jgi:hypothetical protein